MRCFAGFKSADPPLSPPLALDYALASVSRALADAGERPN
jgi:hypothetical protein